MEKYKCVKTFKTDTKQTIKKQSVWEHNTGYVSNSDVRMYTENGDDDSGYIDLTFEQFHAYFIKIA